MTLNRLAERLEALPLHPDRGALDDLSRAIFAALPDGRKPVNGSCPDYADSYDGAMRLIPKGWVARMVRGFDDSGEYWSHVVLIDSLDSPARGVEQRSTEARGGGDLPRFIAAAGLRATAIRGGSHD